MLRLFLIRHAESASNAGLPTESPASNPLSEKGMMQAKRFAELWKDETPHLIVTSPFQRTKMTAAPYREKNPTTWHEEWPVQEWTQLSPDKYKGTTHAERCPAVDAYWDRYHPEYRDGEGAESFVDLFDRVDAMFKRADEWMIGKHGSIAIFTHGHFMRAVIWSRLFPRRPLSGDAMRRFRSFTEAVSIPNLAILSLRIDHGRWGVEGLHDFP
jgi:2,3-bisphosphoglycerate-dependent phosphoglycerate mutase